MKDCLELPAYNYCGWLDMVHTCAGGGAAGRWRCGRDHRGQRPGPLPVCHQGVRAAQWPRMAGAPVMQLARRMLVINDRGIECLELVILW